MTSNFLLMSRASVVLLVLLSEVVSAEDYYWKYMDVRFKTLHETCVYIDAYKGPTSWRVHSSNYTYYTHSEMINKSQGRCMGVTVNAHGVSQRNLGQLTRFGDGCPADSTYNPSTGSCSNDSQKGAPPSPCSQGPSTYGGNPINFAVGNKYQEEIDYSINGLKFSRNYNSLDGLWRGSFSTKLRITPVAISLVLADGREVLFERSNDLITAPVNETGILEKASAGWVYRSPANEIFHFDEQGRLTRKKTPVDSFQLNYTELDFRVPQNTGPDLVYKGATVNVTNNLGNGLTFTTRPDGQPLSVRANGAQVDYLYEADRLVAVSRVQAGQLYRRQFHYEDPRNATWLTGITDELGVRYATWSYDEKGRAISSEHTGGADKTRVHYNADGSSSVTNELGKTATYRFTNINGVKRVIAIEGEPSASCTSSNSSFTYDNRGLLKTKTDNKGILTTFDYNDRGLEVSRTEATGTPQARTITMEWHPSLFLPVVVTEPSRITRYQYDNQGRPLSRTVEAR